MEMDRAIRWLGSKIIACATLNETLPQSTRVDTETGITAMILRRKTLYAAIRRSLASSWTATLKRSKEPVPLSWNKYASN